MNATNFTNRGMCCLLASTLSVMSFSAHGQGDERDKIIAIQQREIRKFSEELAALKALVNTNNKNQTEAIDALRDNLGSKIAAEQVSRTVEDKKVANRATCISQKIRSELSLICRKVSTPSSKTAVCDQSEFLTGGGGNSGPVFRVKDSYPDITNPKAWKVDYVTKDSNTIIGPYNNQYTYAICCRLIIPDLQAACQ
ncbi:MAG: hypothetical protein HQK54_05765 [Oligoflexales bacterium]|nr:hypothetical protein [Oligoflexales bacterium]